ncbi:MAG TPA: AAA family ATPase [Candidatus Babeliales bacterium]|nr:AAA family ATPase [Candidatus Babeliales bacterium]
MINLTHTFFTSITLTFLLFIQMPHIFGMSAEERYQQNKKKPCTFLPELAGEYPKSICDILFRFKKLINEKSENNIDVQNTILFYGPPGTGKSRLAKAIAQRTNAKFHLFSASSFINKFQGSGTEKIEEMFQAVEADLDAGEVVILFIDEIDGIGKERSEHTHGEENRALIELGKQIDKYSEKPNIIIIAASNKSENLDDMIKSRRFEMIEIALPDEKKCETIFTHYLAQYKHNLDQEIPKLAQQAAQNKLSGNDIKLIVTKAIADSQQAESSTILLSAINDRMLVQITEQKKAQEKREQDEKYKQNQKRIAQEQLMQMKETEWQRWKCENWDMVILMAVMDKWQTTDERSKNKKITLTDVYNDFGVSIWTIQTAWLGTALKSPNLFKLTRDELMYSIAKWKREFLADSQSFYEEIIDLRKTIVDPNLENDDGDKFLCAVFKASIEQNQRLKNIIC